MTKKITGPFHYGQSFDIGQLEYVRAIAKANGQRIRVRFRGPRAISVGRAMDNNHGVYRHTKNQSKLECLKADAEWFRVYPL